MYSTSGLLKESQVDIVSSREIEIPSDLLGETSMLHGTGSTAIPGTASSLLGTEVTLHVATAFGFAFKDGGKLFPEISVLMVQAGPFFTLAILFELVAFTYKNSVSKNYLSLATHKDIVYAWHFHFNIGRFIH